MRGGRPLPLPPGEADQGEEGLAGTGVSRQARAGWAGQVAQGRPGVTWQVGAEGRRGSLEQAWGRPGETWARKLPRAANSIS